MTALTNLGIALTAIFAVSLVVLAAQIAWVIWRRNRFLCNNGVVRGGGDGSGGAFREPVKATKELLYFFCWKDSQSSSRVEPDGRAAATTTTAATEGVNVSEDGDNDVLKWHAMYRESRMLYTIKEEEKEGESDCSGGVGLTPHKRRSVGSTECSDAKERDRYSACETAEFVASMTREESAMEVTPFSTPCGSPDRYFTPSPSPPRDFAKMAALC